MDHAEPPAAVEQDVLTLEFMLTAADFREVRDSVESDTLRTAALPAAVVFGVLLAGTLLRSEWDEAAVIAGIGVVVSGVGCLVRWRRLRRLVRWQARHAREHGELVVRLDGEGTHFTDAWGETRIPWTTYRRYAETAHLVLLIMGDEMGHMIVLPRRGVVGDADDDTLSAFVARHLPE
ncbi:YcxB family protein [Streptomyces sp. NPDC049881]|uniref:YcxB family protein n=1 Tax=unclassified Streptomyces TaxID=2593676 RepID=UPI00342BA073